ncbi:MAG: DUF3426 domain-containing protein, partial [Terriglobia bacterium]
EGSNPTPPHPPMTAVEREYLSQIGVTGERMSVASNFLGDTVYYLDAQLTNRGSKTVHEVDLSLTFVDPFGNPVAHKTAQPVTLKSAPLKAGATVPLHLVFEKLPAQWNQSPPAVATAYVRF